MPEPIEIEYIGSRQGRYCLFTPERDVTPPGRQDMVMRAGETYVFPTEAASQSLLTGLGDGSFNAEIVPLPQETADDYPSWYQGEDLTDKKIILWREGGIGDLLMITPVLAELKRRWPSCKITFATSPTLLDVLFENPKVDRLLGMPFTERILKQHDYYFHYMGTIERSPGDPELNAIDMFLRETGLKDNIPSKRKQPFYQLKSNALRKAVVTMEANVKQNDDVILVGVVPDSYNIIRNPAPELIRDILLSLVLKHSGYPIKTILLGKKRTMQYTTYNETPQLYDFRGYTNLPEFAAMLSQCDVVITPDTSAVHLTAALNVRCTALYGPFTAQSRVLYYPRCNAVQGAYRGCTGCMNQEGCIWEDITGYSGCILNINVVKVWMEVEKHLTAVAQEKRSNRENANSNP